MKWGEFKKIVESQGVKDEDEIEYIDVSDGWTRWDELKAFKQHKNLGWCIL